MTSRPEPGLNESLHSSLSGRRSAAWRSRPTDPIYPPQPRTQLQRQPPPNVTPCNEATDAGYNVGARQPRHHSTSSSAPSLGGLPAPRAAPAPRRLFWLPARSHGAVAAALQASRSVGTGRGLRASHFASRRASRVSRTRSAWSRRSTSPPPAARRTGRGGTPGRSPRPRGRPGRRRRPRCPRPSR